MSVTSSRRVCGLSLLGIGNLVCWGWPACWGWPLRMTSLQPPTLGAATNFTDAVRLATFYPPPPGPPGAPAPPMPPPSPPLIASAATPVPVPHCALASPRRHICRASRRGTNPALDDLPPNRTGIATAELWAPPPSSPPPSPPPPYPPTVFVIDAPTPSPSPSLIPGCAGYFLDTGCAWTADSRDPALTRFPTRSARRSPSTTGQMGSIAAAALVSHQPPGARHASRASKAGRLS